jgi:hypothetical protein
VTHERSSGPSLTAGSVVPSAQAVIRPPPTPTRLAPTSRLRTGYRTRRSGASPQNHRAGEGLPSSRRHHANVPSPLRRGVHRGCDSRLYTPSVAFAVKHSARLSLFRPKTVALTARQASLEATDRSLAPPKRAFDAGLRPDPFPDRAASLLPGLLAATRTGLTPVGDDELTLDHDLHIDLQLLGALRISA